MPNFPPFYKASPLYDLRFVRNYDRHAQIRILSSVLLFQLVALLMVRYEECGMDDAETDIDKIAAKLRGLTGAGACQWLREFEILLMKTWVAKPK